MQQTSQKNTAPPDRVLTIAQAAEQLGVSTFTIRRAAQRGDIAVLRLSARRVGIRASELARFMDAATERERLIRADRQRASGAPFSGYLGGAR